MFKILKTKDDFLDTIINSEYDYNELYKDINNDYCKFALWIYNEYTLLLQQSTEMSQSNNKKEYYDTVYYPSRLNYYKTLYEHFNTLAHFEYETAKYVYELITLGFNSPDICKIECFIEESFEINIDTFDKICQFYINDFFVTFDEDTDRHIGIELRRDSDRFLNYNSTGEYNEKIIQLNKIY